MTVKATRHPKTPAQRAQETVDVLTRRRNKLTQQKNALERQARNLAPELEAVTKRLDYAKESPDLPAKTLPGPRPTSSP
jgi:hypothetical protein